jgi:long-chain acyl-CoA synthetase
VRSGDRVALQLSNSPELVIAYYACFQLGAISVPINIRFASPEIEYSINHSGCRVCISQSDLCSHLAPIQSALTTLEHVILIDGPVSPFPNSPSFADLLKTPVCEAAFPDVAEDAVAAVLYTSGTTSRPKGVTHTHGSLNATARFHGTQIGLDTDDIVCMVPPMCHILGFATQMMASLWAGATIVIIPRSDPATVLETIQTQGVTRIAGLPTFYQSLINYPGAEKYSLKSLRTCIGGGDAVPVTLQDKFLATFGVQIFEGCGMTEIIPFTLNLAGDFRKGSIGRACPGATIRLVDDEGNNVPIGSPGEILVRSEAQMRGYWNEPEISAKTLEGGFVHTGDIARRDEDGFYWFAGRKKEIIIRGGSNISPLEVEEVLFQHPAISQCGVVGVPDEDFGEAVWAYVTLRNPITDTEIRQFAQQRIAAYKVPETIRFLDELPFGVTGKVNRRALREKAIRERPSCRPLDWLH